MKTILLLSAAALVLVACTRSQAKDPAAPASAAAKAEAAKKKVIKGKVPPVGEKLSLTDAEWKEKLTDEEFYILRKHGTERAFTGKFWNHKGHGVYTCAACGAPLFDSDTKFRSGTGWPSFHTPYEDGRISEHTDNKLGMTRVEVRCNRCNGHLGHVFNDGPKPTGQRYCINSAALDFSPADAAPTDK